jgi:hypothetical protein
MAVSTPALIDSPIDYAAFDVALSAVTTTHSPSLARRQAMLPSAPTTTGIPGVLSIRTQMLIVSPIAIWLSVGILAFLAGSTVFFVEHRKYIRLLPRDVETPGSILAFVHASRKLQAWARERHEGEQWDEGEGTGLNLPAVKQIFGRKKVDTKHAYDEANVSMGPFDSDHWGVEIDAALART